jgi:hypothetical protein
VFRNRYIVVSIVLSILIGVSVSIIKYRVVCLKKSLKNTEKMIQEKTENIRILKAEWAFLTTPKRLKALCQKYSSNMRPIEQWQVMSYGEFTCSKLVPIDKTSSQNKENHSGRCTQSTHGIGSHKANKPDESPIAKVVDFAIGRI